MSDKYYPTKYIHLNYFTLHVAVLPIETTYTLHTPINPYRRVKTLRVAALLTHKHALANVSLSCSQNTKLEGSKSSDVGIDILQIAVRFGDGRNSP